MGPLSLSQTHVGEALKTVLRTKNTKHMEKSLGSKGTVVSLWIRNGTVNVWDRSGRQWALPAISELATLFPRRAVKVKSEGRRVICKYPFTCVVWRTNRLIQKMDSEAGLKKQLVNSTFSSKHKTQRQGSELPFGFAGASPFWKAILFPPCIQTSQRNPRHPYKARGHPDKGWCPSLACWGPTGALHLLLGRRERAEWDLG